MHDGAERVSRNARPHTPTRVRHSARGKNSPNVVGKANARPNDRGSCFAPQAPPVTCCA